MSHAITSLKFGSFNIELSFKSNLFESKYQTKSSLIELWTALPKHMINNFTYLTLVKGFVSTGEQERGGDEDEG